MENILETAITIKQDLFTNLIAPHSSYSFVHLYLKEISMGVYQKVHQIVKYLKLKWMNPSIEHKELMLAWIKFRIEALLREHV